MITGDQIALNHLAGAQLMGFMLVLARVGGLFLLAPGFSSKMIPVRAKLMLAFAISLAIMPIATHGQQIPSDPGAVVTLLLTELLVGLAFAMPLAVLGAAVSAGAGLIDTIIGFSFAAQIDPITNQQNAVMAQFYSLFATMVFLLTGGDHLMIEGLGASYRLLPLGRIPNINALAASVPDSLERVFVIGLEISAPVVIALVISDAAFGLISRAVPQMNVFFVGLPAKILLGFAVIGASLPFVAAHLTDELQTSVVQALELLKA
ncbi:MAG TPA: flagellar biosynthetic protein FliR [Gaiellales bacterium]|nr:flagellar biosynthetic protein FliR [Gaiellales bacterium]